MLHCDCSKVLAAALCLFFRASGRALRSAQSFVKKSACRLDDLHRIVSRDSDPKTQESVSACAIEPVKGEEGFACRLDQQIAELEARATARAKGTQKVPEAGKRSLAEVNKQNALRNMENALRNVTSRPEGSRNLTADGVDPFSRRQTRPMNYWSTKRNTGSTRTSIYSMLSPS